MRRPAHLAVAIIGLVVLTGAAAGWAMLPADEGGVVSSVGPLWVRAPTRTPLPTATARPTNTPAPWARTATARAMPTATPIPAISPPAVPSRGATATARNTATLTPVPATPALAGIGRPPQRCATEFAVTGSASFALSVWDNLAMIHTVSPDDYDLAMACTADGARTRVRRIVQADRLYSDSSGTVWVRDGIGYLSASSLLHEMLHITAYGWNASGSMDCRPEDNTLEHQAAWLDKAADKTSDRAQADALRYLADWFRGQKGTHNCPAP